MESKSLTLDDLTNLFDDVNAEDTFADETPENTGVPVLGPIPAGKYGVKLTAIDVDRDQEGNVRNKLQYVCDFEVIDPEAVAGRKIRFIRVSAQSRSRKVKGVDFKYTELYDLVHAFDPDFLVQNSPERAIRFLLERIQDNAVAYIQVDWKAWDTKHFIASNGDELPEGEEKKALMKACSFRGQRKFAADGTVINPVSGNTLKANAYMKWAYIPKRSVN